jgi:hypothetical protein
MVEYVTIKGKKYPIRISYYALLKAQKDSEISLDKLDSDLGTQQELLWYALEAGHHFVNEKMPEEFKKEDAAWYLDECYLEFQEAIYVFVRQLVETQERALIRTGKKKS